MRLRAIALTVMCRSQCPCGIAVGNLSEFHCASVPGCRIALTNRQSSLCLRLLAVEKNSEFHGATAACSSCGNMWQCLRWRIVDKRKQFRSGTVACCACACIGNQAQFLINAQSSSLLDSTKIFTELLWGAVVCWRVWQTEEVYNACTDLPLMSLASFTEA